MTTDARIPAVVDCALRPLLERWAAVQPDKVFVKVSAAEEVTYREMRDMAASTGAGLARLGVKQGDTVVVWELLEFLIPRMPHFMVPRYVRTVEALPKTPTQKIQKHLLKADGLTQDTWDREKAGITVKRQRL